MFVIHYIYITLIYLYINNSLMDYEIVFSVVSSTVSWKYGKMTHCICATYNNVVIPYDNHIHKTVADMAISMKNISLSILSKCASLL